jgi:hypothetical protein
VILLCGCSRSGERKNGLVLGFGGGTDGGGQIKEVEWGMLTSHSVHPFQSLPPHWSQCFDLHPFPLLDDPADEDVLDVSEDDVLEASVEDVVREASVEEVVPGGSEVLAEDSEAAAEDSDEAALDVVVDERVVDVDLLVVAGGLGLVVGG